MGWGCGDNRLIQKHMDIETFKDFEYHAKANDFPINTYIKQLEHSKLSKKEESKLSLMLCADISTISIHIRDEQTNQEIVIADVCQTDASYLYFCTKHSLLGQTNHSNSIESYNHRLKYHISDKTEDNLQNITIYDAKYKTNYEMGNLSQNDLYWLYYSTRILTNLLSWC